MTKYYSCNLVEIGKEITASASVFRAGLRAVMPINETVALLQHSNLRNNKNLEAEDLRRELHALDWFLYQCDRLARQSNLKNLDANEDEVHGVIPAGTQIPTFFMEEHSEGGGDDIIATLITESQISSFEMIAHHQRSKAVEALLSNNNCLALNIRRDREEAHVSMDQLVEQGKNLDAMYGDRSILEIKDKAGQFKYLNVKVCYANNTRYGSFHFLVVSLSDLVVDRVINAYRGNMMKMDEKLEHSDAGRKTMEELRAPGGEFFIPWAARKFNSTMDRLGLSILDYIG